MDAKRYEEVLEQLDKLAKEYGFPAFGAGTYYIDSRMSVFADKSYWGILIEVIDVSTGDMRHYRNFDVVYRFGNCLSRPLSAKETRFLRITSDGDDGPVFGEGDQGDYLNPNVKTMRLRGHLVTIPRDPRVYKSKGIKLVSKEKINPKDVIYALDKGTLIVNKKKIYPEELLRAMTPEYREYFFLNDEEKQTEFLYPIPKTLQLEEWRHPLYDESNILEPPSKCEAFQLIAKVIATCDPSVYKPTERPNTHWSNWLIADKCL
jgi:hypothetical protein